MLFLSNTRLCALAVATIALATQNVAALDCPRGGISNTTAVRKTYPVPPIVIYPLVGDYFNTAWSTLYSFNYSGLTHPPTPPNSSQLTPPNATRTIIFNGFTFNEDLLYINDTAPVESFEMRWNLSYPEITKPYDNLIIDAYVQDFKVSHACDGYASLLEWTIEYCCSNQLAGWYLFQNTTVTEADALAQALNITGADDGTWDVGCAIPMTTSTTDMPMTSTDMPISTTTSSSATARKTVNSKNHAAMVTHLPSYGGAFALAVAAAVVL